MKLEIISDIITRLTDLEVANFLGRNTVALLLLLLIFIVMIYTLNKSRKFFKLLFEAEIKKLAGLTNLVGVIVFLVMCIVYGKSIMVILTIFFLSFIFCLFIVAMLTYGFKKIENAN